MALSPDLIASIAFGVIMTFIGIVALWAVRWQAFFLLRHQSKGFPFQHLWTIHPNIPLLVAIHDEEHALHLSRSNSDTLADGNDALVLHPESAAEDQPMPFEAKSQILQSDPEPTAVSVSLLDWSRLPF
jgi:hypothetical protein